MEPTEATLPLFGEEPARPLADRLRPTRLDEVVGQDHLLAPDAPLGRMVAQQRLSSAILWGPPGVGKTTIARLLADAGEPRLRTGVGHLLRRGRPAQGLRRRTEPTRHRPGHPAVRRRDPPLQPCPAGQLPPLRRGRHGHPDRRHHGEPELRTQRRPPLPHPGPRPQTPRRSSAVHAARPCRAAHRSPSGAGRRRPPRPDRHGGRRRPLPPQHGRTAPGHPGHGDSWTPPGSPITSSSAPRCTTRRRRATTT